MLVAPAEDVEAAGVYVCFAGARWSGPLTLADVDILVGEPTCTSGSHSESGRAYPFYGSASGFAANWSQSGTASYERLGYFRGRPSPSV